MGKIIDITGQTFGHLKALNIERHGDRMAWRCQCECGKITYVTSYNLRYNKVQSCGCQRNSAISKKLFKDLTGQTFGKLFVLDKTDQRQAGAVVWKCQCECGNISYVPTGNLKSGHTTSCGCKKYDNSHLHLQLLGQKFGKLTVLEELPAKNQQSYWRCQCDCGNIIETYGTYLNTGIVLSCGCLKSKGELKIGQLLSEHNILFEKQKSFDTCVSPKGTKLKFDFYIDNRYLLEYDGECHYFHVNSGWSNEEQLAKCQLHDQIKNEWCKKNNIPLIRIPYTKYNELTIEDLILKGE